MEIISLPHPTLRYKSKPVKRINAELRAIVQEMFELMFEANGIGLAANQVDLPLRLFVVNTTAKKGEGEELVFINPVLTRGKGRETAEEGCLSLAGIYGPVARFKNIHVDAYGIDGKPYSADLSGMMARDVQQETDHLDGVMFTDRMNQYELAEIEAELEEFEIEFRSKRTDGSIPDDTTVFARLADFESQFC